MIIGVDFDNTIVDYTHVFAAAAAERGLVPPAFTGSKRHVRDTIRRRPDGEMEWQSLQGEIYGPRMHQAVMFAGAGDFLRACRSRGVPVHIVSQKTRTNRFDPARIDLRETALEWLRNEGFFDPGVIGMSEENVFFEDTRVSKVARLAALECTHFIDDLVEVFEEPTFPENVRRLLFSPADEQNPPGPHTVCRSWNQITESLFDGTPGAHA